MFSIVLSGQQFVCAIKAFYAGRSYFAKLYSIQSLLISPRSQRDDQLIHFHTLVFQPSSYTLSHYYINIIIYLLRSSMIYFNVL